MYLVPAEVGAIQPRSQDVGICPDFAWRATPDACKAHQVCAGVGQRLVAGKVISLQVPPAINPDDPAVSEL